MHLNRSHHAHWPCPDHNVHSQIEKYKCGINVVHIRQTVSGVSIHRRACALRTHTHTHSISYASWTHWCKHCAHISVFTMCTVWIRPILLTLYCMTSLTAMIAHPVPLSVTFDTAVLLLRWMVPFYHLECVICRVFMIQKPKLVGLYISLDWIAIYSKAGADLVQLYTVANKGGWVDNCIHILCTSLNKTKVKFDSGYVADTIQSNIK